MEISKVPLFNPFALKWDEKSIFTYFVVLHGGPINGCWKKLVVLTLLLYLRFGRILNKAIKAVTGLFKKKKWTHQCSGNYLNVLFLKKIILL